MSFKCLRVGSMSQAYETSGLSRLSQILKLELQASQDVLPRLISTGIHSVKKAQYRKRVIQGLRGQSVERWSRYAAIEKKCRMYFAAEGSDDMKKLFEDTIGQLSFQHNLLKQLNFMPYVLLFLSVFKIWLVPAMALLSPLFMIVMPYILIRYVYTVPMTIGSYVTLMKKLWFSNLKDIKNFGQVIFFVVSFVQGIVQPIQNAMHCRRTDTVICEVGDTVLELRDHLEDLRADFQRFGISYSVPTTLRDLTEKRHAFFFVHENKSVLPDIWRRLGELEILWKLAQNPEFHEISFTQSQTPVLHIPHLRDLGIPKDLVTLSSVYFSANSAHALLTGPNGGGKSSALRGILQTVLLAQTFGVAASSGVVLSPFSWISTGLQLRDEPGAKSLFETEVRFAVKVLGRKRGLGLVLYDEIFHSTNPPDCAHTASVFLNQLWAKPNVLSLVSTHVFEIVKAAPPQIQRLCVSGIIKDKTLVCDYRLKEGVCTVSSVDTILRREGLLRG